MSIVHALFLPSVSSVPNTIARAPDTLTQCSSECCRRLWLMSAASTPTIARPNHRATTRGRLSMYKATTSPSAQPCASTQCATAWHCSCRTLKLQTWNKKIRMKKQAVLRMTESRFCGGGDSFLKSVKGPHLSRGLIDQGGFVWVPCHYLGKQGGDSASISQISVHGKPYPQYDNQAPFTQGEEEKVS